MPVLLSAHKFLFCFYSLCHLGREAVLGKVAPGLHRGSQKRCKGSMRKFGKCIIVNMLISFEMLIGLTLSLQTYQHKVKLKFFFQKLVFRGSALSKTPPKRPK